ncbi:MAG: TetR/AcrR family transcriptional regulator [Bacteroidota bacterium]
MIPRGKIKDKRKAILESSLELIALQGFHGTSMKQIADNAQVAAGTIYVYFEKKDVLIHELFIEIRRELNDIIVGGFDKKKDFKANFMVFWNDVLNYYLQYPLKYNFLEQFSNSPFINDIISEEGSQALAPVYGLFADAQKKGILKKLPVSALIALTHGPIVSLVKMNNFKEIEIEEQIDKLQFAEASWQSISIK